MKTLSEMIACAKREAAIRKRVYPKWVESRRMTADQCRHEIETMLAIVVELEMRAKERDLFDTSEP
jgi:hypothetical protein